MQEYDAPLAEIEFALRSIAGFDEVAALPGCEEVDDALAAGVLAEAARFARQVLSPLNHSGDREGARLADGGVRAPAGFAAAYAAFVAGGWNGLALPRQYGGQGLPRLLGAAVEEMWNGANLSFALAPLLTSAVAEALLAHASPSLQASYLPQLVRGTWCGAMVLTEPQAGSDLAAVRTLATPTADGYRICGQKIFITWGEHDLAENIVHLVLARTPDAPAGVRGLSLFVVPKHLGGAGSGLAQRNDIRCLALERKLGIHASPTCVLAFGEREGAFGQLVGEPHRGLECMFTTMNYARLGVGLQAVALSERAYQQARAYAQTRIQGREGADEVAIVRHPDVRRMLLSMKVRTEAMRALTYFAAAACDIAARHPDAAVRRRKQVLVDLLTPVVKGWCTEQAVDIASLGMQVHGGMGYIEETGAAQYLRDARITTIYEGTTGIQANDLIGRKLLADGGATVAAFIAGMRSDAARLDALRETPPALVPACMRGFDALDHATHWLVRAERRQAAAGAVPYLELLGTVAGGWLMARAACASPRSPAHAALHAAKRMSALYYAHHVLPRAEALAATITSGAPSVLEYDDAWW